MTGGSLEPTSMGRIMHKEPQHLAEDFSLIRSRIGYPAIDRKWVGCGPSRIGMKDQNSRPWPWRVFHPKSCARIRAYLAHREVPSVESGFRLHKT